MRELILFILTTLSTITMTITLGALIVVIQNTHALKEDLRKILELSNTPQAEQAIITQNIDYSFRVLEFTRKTTIEVTRAAFRTFIDGKDETMITAQMTKNLINDIAQEVKTILLANEVMFSQTSFTDDFIANYIINTISNTVKDLLEQSRI